MSTPKKKGKEKIYTLTTKPCIDGYLYVSIPVSNLDSDSVSISPVVCVTNLALVYLRTISGPQGPKPLPKNMRKKNIKQR